MPSSSHKSWGLALSGGAAWGIANAGVLEAFEKEGLTPDYIAGSSMGAIVGGIFALGYRSKELKLLIKDISLRNVALLRNQPLQGGLHGGFLMQNLEELLRPLIGHATIGDAKIPFVCIAGKVKEPITWRKIVRKGFTRHLMDRVELHVFPPQTPMLDALLASSAIPVIFAPMEINGESFIDLCDFGAIPARTLRSIHHPDILIGTDTAPRHEKIRKLLPPGWQEFLLMGQESLEESRKACDLVIRPDSPAALFRLDKAEEFWEAGKNAAEDQMPEIQKILNNRL